MVPVCSWLLNGEIVDERRARWNVTLSDTNWAVHLVGAILEQAVEVDTRALIAEL